MEVCTFFRNPLNSGHGIHEVFRATPIPQPIPNTEPATQYQLSKTHLLMSLDQTNFAEVTEQELSTLLGLHGLRLWKQPFSTSRSQKITCLTGLFFNLPAAVLKLCAEGVIALPQHPQALYLYDSTYLLTSAKGDFVIQNVTAAGDIKMPGCQSCLVRQTCDGRLQLPNAGLFLTPRPSDMFDRKYYSCSYPPIPPFTIFVWETERVWRSCCSRRNERCSSGVIDAFQVDFSVSAGPFRDRRDARGDCAAIPARIEVRTYNTHQKSVARRHAAWFGYFFDVGAGCSCHMGGKKGNVECSPPIHRPNGQNTKRRRRRCATGRRCNILDEERGQRIAAPNIDPWKSNC